MDLLPSPEQAELVASTAAFLAEKLPVERTRSRFGESDPVDAVAWAEAAALGWFAIGLPEVLGGYGAGLVDEVLVLREVGRSLAAGPWIASMLGARVAAAGGRADLAEAVVAGTARVAWAVPISPERLHLVDAAGAEHALVVDEAGAALYAVADLAGVSPVGSIDPASSLTAAMLSGSPVAAVQAAIDAVHRRALVLVAAQLAGIAEATRDISAEHARTRFQFDKPIGVNQAVKHPCADMAIRCEAAWSQVLFAALAHDEGRADAEFHAISAHVVAADAAERNAAATVQVLGGMGFTAEHNANLYVKRAHVISHVCGGPRALLSRLIHLPAAV